MKKIILTVPFLLLLFLNAACDKDDGNPTAPTTQDLLIGKWLIQEEGDIVNGVKYKNEMTGCRTKDTYEFSKTQTFTNHYHDDIATDECDIYIENGLWALKDNHLQLFIRDENNPTEIEEININVAKVTETELHLEDRQSIIHGNYYYLKLTRVK